jgi:hypothetical protein
MPGGYMADHHLDDQRNAGVYPGITSVSIFDRVLSDPIN